MSDNGLSRRDLLKGAAVGAAALGALKAGAAPVKGEAEMMAQPKGKSVIGLAFEPKDNIRIGIIGVGGRGSSLLSDLLAIPNAKIVAIGDLVKDKVVRAQREVMAKGQAEPTGYWRNEKDYENLCKRDDLDLILVATPWNWHTPMALCAMRNGHHVGVEVPCAETLKDCWELVDVSEQTQKHCMILENCCYGFWEMTLFNMTHKGLLGELTHGEAAYIHNLRGLLMAPDGEGEWRWKPHVTRDGNFYPTHGLGPVCNYMDINRGDRMTAIVSMSSQEAALSSFNKKNPPSEEAKRKAKFKAGDMNTSLIKTELGRTIMVQHDVVTPRPYSRLNLIQGTTGTFADYPPRLAVDTVDDAERWLTEAELTEMKTKWEHPMWKEVGEIARKNGGHGGMDYIMLWRLIHCMRKGLTPDIDVYDTAAWSAPVALSEESVKKGGALLKFPDFTRGRWQEKRKIFEN